MNRVTPLIALGLIATLTLVSGCVVIEDGEVGVSKSFGTISDDAVGPGVAIQFPVVRQTVALPGELDGAHAGRPVAVDQELGVGELPGLAEQHPRRPDRFQSSHHAPEVRGDQGGRRLGHAAEPGQCIPAPGLHRGCVQPLPAQVGEVLW